MQHAGWTARALFYFTSDERKSVPMDYAMIGKLEKAKRYAEERDRIEFKQFEVVFTGNHSDHMITYDQGQWQCNCDFFQSRNRCSHTMALETILDQMVSISRDG